jgi:hypothetical protein
VAAEMAEIIKETATLAQQTLAAVAAVQVVALVQ